MTSEEYAAYIKEIMDARIRANQRRANKIFRRKMKETKQPDPEIMASREFLLQFVNGTGVDVCCGDMVISEETIGVDFNRQTLGVDYTFAGDALDFAKSGEMDYVVSNYLEAIPQTLTALNEWFRVLKSGGVLGLVCRDANQHKHKEGALVNRRRVHTFTKVTLTHYLHRAGFINVNIIETEYGTLNVEAHKP